jgi:hypothetical protein
VPVRQLVDQLGDRPGSARLDVVPGFENLGEDPLGPAIVRRVGGGDAATWVVGQTEPAELATLDSVVVLGCCPCCTAYCSAGSPNASKPRVCITCDPAIRR